MCRKPQLGHATHLYTNVNLISACVHAVLASHHSGPLILTHNQQETYRWDWVNLEWFWRPTSKIPSCLQVSVGRRSLNGLATLLGAR